MAKERLFSENIQLEQLNSIGDGCMIGHLGIEMIEVGSDYLKAKMPVDERTKQPMGLLHGGANVALAESLGSYASTLLVDLLKQSVVGIEINANHIRSARDGYVYGVVKPIHVGRRTHVWSIEITNEEGKMVSISRLTVGIIENK